MTVNPDPTPILRVGKKFVDARREREPFSADQKATLRENLISEAICPPSYMFRDVPEVREVLGLGDEDK